MAGRATGQGRARDLGARIMIASAGLMLSVGGGVAAAQDGVPPLPESDGGAATSSTSGSSDSGSVTLKSEDVSPGKVFFSGTKKAVYDYSIGGSQPRDLKIEAVHQRSGKVAKSWKEENVQPDSGRAVRWGGTKDGGGAAHKGSYIFRVREVGGALADRTQAKGDRSFELYPHKFPVRGRHTYGDGFGAPRSGHRHQGQDILAHCGKRVVAARGGKVQWRAHQASGAGYYLVIDGKATGHDYAYMHLKRHGRPRQGDRVRTGERIGYVGQTGDASGCHLHFELWSAPGWYEGGHAMSSVTKHLKKWDRWS